MKKRTVRKKRRRYDPIRLAIVVGVALALVGTAGVSCYALVRSVSGKGEPVAKNTSMEVSSEEILPSSSLESGGSSSSRESSEKDEVKLTKLVSLKENVELAFQDNSLKELKEQINAYLTANNFDPNKVSWAIQDLVTGETAESSNAKQNFTAASTYKLPLCVYYYEEIAAGRINANDSLDYTEEMREKEDDENLNQPIHRKFKVGDKIQIDELLEAALLYSDNIAGHMLYENVGGYDKFKHLVAKYTDQPQTEEFFSEMSNVINADYMMRLLHHIYTTPGVFNDLKYWLQMTGIETFLNRSVPGTYIQKIGNFDEVRNAVGIYNGNPPFTLSVYTCISKTDGMRILADLGQLCLTYFQNRYLDGFYSNYDLSRFYELNAQMSSPVDVIALRPGPNGQTLPDLTEEEQKKMDAQTREELGDAAAGSEQQASSTSNASQQAPAQPAPVETPSEPQPSETSVETPAPENPAEAPAPEPEPAVSLEAPDPASSAAPQSEMESEGDSGAEPEESSSMDQPVAKAFPSDFSGRSSEKLQPVFLF